MKLCICFLVVASSAVSSGQSVQTNDSSIPEATAQLNQTQIEDPQPTSVPTSPQANTLVDIKVLGSDGSEQADRNSTEEDANNSTVKVVIVTVSKRGPTTSTPSGVDVTTAFTETKSTSKPVEIKDSGSSSWGYVILVLIILVIIILCVILYFLRRVSRTYSFDLQRPSPVSRLNEPVGTFEPVYLDDLEQPAPNDQVTTDEVSPPPVANGTSQPSEEKASSGESAPQEQPDANGLETSPVVDSSSSSGESLADKTPSPSTSTNLLFDGVGEEQKNENNNNPIVCSTNPFVEINLDEPALCDQLLTSPQATSSVLPFSFSLTSSS
ncbi:hypothetical protein Q5P01_002796 [Channa striata]|uniref:Uncharacterized protein n=1 Tax=Channa striata TaxID=64152 RepID=A0AA88NTT3_CHASR|nr:hypothetical protein Q5P01_002796 [Channa striata]